jgi:hypothetical protein
MNQQAVLNVCSRFGSMSESKPDALEAKYLFDTIGMIGFAENGELGRELEKKMLQAAVWACAGNTAERLEISRLAMTILANLIADELRSETSSLFTEQPSQSVGNSKGNETLQEGTPVLRNQRDESCRGTSHKTSGAISRVGRQPRQLDVVIQKVGTPDMGTRRKLEVVCGKHQRIEVSNEDSETVCFDACTKCGSTARHKQVRCMQGGKLIPMWIVQCDKCKAKSKPFVNRSESMIDWNGKQRSVKVA